MVEQGTQEWLNEKLGVISGTRAADLMGTKLANRKLLATLTSEIVTADTKSIPQTPAMRRGLEIEDEAVSYYSVMFDRIVTGTKDYIEHPDTPYLACSPDGLIDDDGGYEGKRLDEHNHIMLLQGAVPDKKYVWQCKWNMFIAGRRWWDLFYYCETLPDSMKWNSITIERDEADMKALHEAAFGMLDELDRFLFAHGLGGLK